MKKLQQVHPRKEPKTWTFVLKGYDVEYKTLRKCSLFMYEICKRISAYENARIAFESYGGVVAEPAVTIVSGITESIVILETAPYHKFARLTISTHQQIKETEFSVIFGEFFQAKLTIEKYVEHPE